MESKWDVEDSVEIKTLKNSDLSVERIVYRGEDPPKRCIAITKNRRSVAFDLEMVPVIISSLKKVCPDSMLPEELRSATY